MPSPESPPLSAQVGRVAERGAARVQLRHEGVGAAVGGRVEGARRRREVRRARVPGHVGVAGGVERDAVAVVAAASAQVGGVAEGGAARVELRHEGVAAAVVGSCRRRPRSSGSRPSPCPRSRRRCRRRPRAMPLPVVGRRFRPGRWSRRGRRRSRRASSRRRRRRRRCRSCRRRPRSSGSPSSAVSPVT